MFIQFVLFSLLFGGLEAAIQCKDMNNNNVDWFIFYKLPRLPTPTNTHIQSGTGFIYLDANHKNWTLPTVGMDSTNHAVFHTLKQFYSNPTPNNTYTIMFNDEFPNSTIWSEVSGHTKGMVQFDHSSGFWLIHSIPKFPSNQSYEFPSNAHWYGQTGICVSLSYSKLGDIGNQLYYNRPFIYYNDLPEQMATDYPVLTHVKNGDYRTTAPFTSKKTFSSLGGVNFVHFAKCGNFGKDIYFDLISPTLATSLNVETWQHGSQNLFSECDNLPNHNVFNAKNITLPFAINFDNYEDHSKFAVATNANGVASSNWVCIGDINRQTHQLERGGGSMCIRDPELYNVYKTIISATYPCKSSKPFFAS